MSARVLSVMLFAVALAGCQDRPPGRVTGPTETATTTTATTPAVYTREKFRQLVIGKTPDEVVANVGKANRTVESGTAVFWYYDARTTNPANGKADNKAQVVFRNGKAAEVNY